MEERPVPDIPESPVPDAAPAGGVDEPRASALTTVLLATALVIVVVITGVLGAVAVLMTTNPDALPGAAKPRKLTVPIYFAPVTGSQPAPCPGVKAAVDPAGTTCYLMGDGVRVTAVHAIESVRERDGTYAVRVALPSPFRERVGDLTREMVNQQIAVLAGPKLVAAPKVAQPVRADSLSIAGGFDKATADALVAELLGTATPSPSPVAPVPSTPASPSTLSTDPAVSPASTDPATAPAVTAPNAQGTDAAPTGTLDPRLGSCKEAIAAGYGPYFKETHPEYHYYEDVDNNGIACDSRDL